MVVSIKTDACGIVGHRRNSLPTDRRRHSGQKSFHVGLKCNYILCVYSSALRDPV